jgi:hypothetical protein
VNVLESNMNQDEWAAVRQAIYEGFYDDARALLKAINTRSAGEMIGWLGVLQCVEQQDFAAAQGVLDQMLAEAPTSAPLRQMRDLMRQRRYADVHARLLRVMDIPSRPRHAHMQEALRAVQVKKDLQAESLPRKLNRKFQIGTVLAITVTALAVSSRVFRVGASQDLVIGVLCGGAALVFTFLFLAFQNSPSHRR